MARPRSIPDADIYATVRRLLAEGGDKAVTFGSVAQATGLAPPSLAQRYGSREGMVKAALLAAWDALDALVPVAAGAATSQGLLKALGPVDVALLAAGMRDADLRARAAAWRAAVETELARHFGSGAKAREAAAMLFAAWQGARIWEAAGGRGFRMKDVARRLG